MQEMQGREFRHLADKHSESISEAEQIDEGLPELRQRTPHRYFSPDQDVPMPHGQGFAARCGQRPVGHQRRSLPVRRRNTSSRLAGRRSGLIA